MPKLANNALPKYRRHKKSGRAVVSLSGRDHSSTPSNSRARDERPQIPLNGVVVDRQPTAGGSSRG
jgi:hypothetical protein